MIKSFPAAALTVVVMSVATCNANAALTYVSQARSAYARVGVAAVTADEQTVTAPDFGPFNQTAAATVGAPYPGSSNATQVSSLSPTGITTTGVFTWQRPAAAGTGSVSAESKLDVIFTVDQPTGFTLSGLMPASPIPQGFAPDIRSITLNGPGVAINLTDPGAFSQAGSFAVGQYQLVVDGEVADSILRPHTGSQDFNVSLAVAPEPASLATLVLGGLSLGSRRRRA